MYICTYGGFRGIPKIIGFHECGWGGKPGDNHWHGNESISWDITSMTGDMHIYIYIYLNVYN